MHVFAIGCQEGRAIISEPVREAHETHPELVRAVGKLVVHNLHKTKDAGFYKCQVEDQSSNRNSAIMNVIKILGMKYLFGRHFTIFMPI